MWKKSPPTDRNCENTAIFFAIRAKWLKPNIFFLNCLPMLRNDPNSISTGKYEFVWRAICDSGLFVLLPPIVKKWFDNREIYSDINTNYISKIIYYLL